MTRHLGRTESRLHREFRVLTNNSIRSTALHGGIVNVVTKAGSGAARTLRVLPNTAWTRELFSPERRNSSRTAAHGGAASNEEAVFFGDYQATRTTQGSNRTDRRSLVPERAGNFVGAADSLTAR